MNINILSPITTGHGTYQPGETATLPDAEAWPLIKCGAAAPADRRARRLVDEAKACESAALELATPEAAIHNPDRRPRDNGGIVKALQVRAANWRDGGTGRQGRFYNT